MPIDRGCRADQITDISSHPTSMKDISKNHGYSTIFARRNNARRSNISKSIQQDQDVILLINHNLLLLLHDLLNPFLNNLIRILSINLSRFIPSLTQQSLGHHLSPSIPFLQQSSAQSKEFLTCARGFSFIFGIEFSTVFTEGSADFALLVARDEGWWTGTPGK